MSGPHLGLDGPQRLVRRPRRPFDLVVEADLVVHAVFAGRVAHVVQDGGAVRDRLRLRPGTEGVAERVHVRVRANAGVAEQVPGAPDGAAPFQQHETLARTPHGQMAGGADARQAGAHDQTSKCSADMVCSLSSTWEGRGSSQADALGRPGSQAHPEGARYRPCSVCAPGPEHLRRRRRRPRARGWRRRSRRKPTGNLRPEVDPSIMAGTARLGMLRTNPSPAGARAWRMRAISTPGAKQCCSTHTEMKRVHPQPCAAQRVELRRSKRDEARGRDVVSRQYQHVGTDIEADHRAVRSFDQGLGHPPDAAPVVEHDHARP